MKEFNITLTEAEIEFLQICLCHVQLDLNNEADYLREHNKTGINTRSIERKRERARECEKIWHKLYDCAKIS